MSDISGAEKVGPFQDILALALALQKKSPAWVSLIKKDESVQLLTSDGKIHRFRIRGNTTIAYILENRVALTRSRYRTCRGLPPGSTTSKATIWSKVQHSPTIPLLIPLVKIGGPRQLTAAASN